MKLKVTAIALCGLLPITAFAQDEGSDRMPGPSPTPGPGNRWVVELYNVDDFMTVTCNGKRIGTAGYNQTVPVSLDSCLKGGQPNDFIIEAFNNSGGWTFGYRVLKNGSVAVTESGHRAERECGTVGSSGCNNNDQSTGRRYHKRYYFER